MVTRDNDPGWAQLPAAARREQALLSSALGALFTHPQVDVSVSGHLGYPGWPQPLTLLPGTASTDAPVPQLAAYLAHVALTSQQIVALVDAHGWPPRSTAAADAAWLLMQHADTRNEARVDLLPWLSADARRGAIDPRQVALLTDRVLTVNGDPQRYATLRLIRDSAVHLLYPLEEDEAEVDRRRKELGMPSLDDDAQFAFSPIHPYGTGRMFPVNPWLPKLAETLHPDPVDDSNEQHPPVPDDRIGVYLGATLRLRNEALRLRDRLPAEVYCTSRWIDLDPLTRASCQFDAGPALNQFAGRLCLADIRRSRVIIGDGRHRSHGLSVEVGVALAHHIPVVLVGGPSCSFDGLPQCHLVGDLDTAITTAVRLGALR